MSVMWCFWVLLVCAAHQGSPDDVLVQRRVLLRVRRAAGLVVVRRAVGGRLLVLQQIQPTGLLHDANIYIYIEGSFEQASQSMARP